MDRVGYVWTVAIKNNQEPRFNVLLLYYEPQIDMRKSYPVESTKRPLSTYE